MDNEQVRLISMAIISAEQKRREKEWEARRNAERSGENSPKEIEFTDIIGKTN
jgi:hypothetical protein